MGILRSETMHLYKYVVSKDNAWQVMNTFGRIQKCHLLDLNKDEKPFELIYANMIKRCQEANNSVK